MRFFRRKAGPVIVILSVAAFAALIMLGIYTLAEKSSYTSTMFEMSCSVSYSNGNRGAVAVTDGGDFIKLEDVNLTSVYNMLHTAGFAGRGRRQTSDEGILIYFDDGNTLAIYRNGTDSIYFAFTDETRTRCFKAGYDLKYDVLEQLCSLDGISFPNSIAKRIPEGASDR